MIDMNLLGDEGRVALIDITRAEEQRKVDLQRVGNQIDYPAPM